MKKNLLFSLLFLSFVQIFSQIIALPEASGVKGSKLCANLALNYSVDAPSDVKYTVETVVNKDKEAKEITLNYFLTSSETGGSVSVLQTSLEEYFVSPDYSTFPGETWKVIVKLSINGILKRTENFNCKPFAECSEVKSNCDSLVVYRKMLEPVCPSYLKYPKHYYTYSGNNIYVYFEDSLSTSSQITCMAVGFRLYTDSIVIRDFEAKKYNLYQFKKTKINCVTTPCPQYLYGTNFMQEVDFSQCSTIIPSDFTLKGSVLCGNLKMEYAIPEAYQKGYNVSVTLGRNELDSKLHASYNIVSNEKVSVGTKLSVGMNHLFSKKEEYTSLDLTEVIYVSLRIDGADIGEGLVRITPFQECFDFEYECNKVSVNRNFIGYNYSTTQVNFVPRVVGDSIFVDFSESRWMIYSTETTSVDSNLVVINSINETQTQQKNTAIISDLENRLYLVYAKYQPYAIVLDGNTYVRPSYQYLGAADLSTCLVNGTDDFYVKQTNIFPNPSNDFINIEGFEGEITFMSPLGKSYQVSGNEQINISNIPSGLYIVNYQLNGVSFQEKLIIE